ncbi:MAG: hypothetical protein M1827_006310 [Pycnora praestabilis]|nr:MAG: hypothetical protein M1827_006310 [Pycnora praestabilis]
MPLGIERINARKRQPNDRIVFIKPLEGPDKALAQDFLERIAAICSPIMKANHLAIMSLEEYEPNTEFVGRNFNAGEVIQLVLKAPYSGHWLPFRHVQMVMMHELAHCKQMNHSGAFWKVRNQFAGELRELWTKKYTGDGFWGKGTFLSGQYTTTAMPASEDMPQSLCGGTYRSSRGRKRKRKLGTAKPSLTYAERQQRRIGKKFGTKGIALGDDEDTRVKLEDGRKPKGKPRVAGSTRGRELRAAAALQRLVEQRIDEVKKEEDGSGSETESDYDEIDIKKEALDVNGEKMFDGKGNGMVKVCEDEDEGDADVQRELKELRQVIDDAAEAYVAVKEEDVSTASEDDLAYRREESVLPGKGTGRLSQAIGTPSEGHAGGIVPETVLGSTKALSPDASASKESLMCLTCSMINDPPSTICIACSNVLNLERAPDHWRCQSQSCHGSQYVNAADCGICGVCGSRRLS